MIIHSWFVKEFKNLEYKVHKIDSHSHTLNLLFDTLWPFSLKIQLFGNSLNDKNGRKKNHMYV